MTPLEAAWEFYGGTVLTNRPGRNKAKCPLHEDSTASAVVDLDKETWRCYAGCGWGDVYNLVAKAAGIQGFPNQKKFVQERFGESECSTPNRTSKANRKPWRAPWKK